MTFPIEISKSGIEKFLLKYLEPFIAMVSFHFTLFEYGLYFLTLLTKQNRTKRKHTP